MSYKTTIVARTYTNYRAMCPICGWFGEWTLDPARAEREGELHRKVQSAVGAYMCREHLECLDCGGDSPRDRGCCDGSCHCHEEVAS